jgi:hypothetical protein
MPRSLSPTRRWCRPSATETLESIAARELADLPPQDALARLREWNPHLTRLRRNYQYLLVSDVVFLEGLPGEGTP